MSAGEARQELVLRVAILQRTRDVVRGPDHRDAEALAGAVRAALYLAGLAAIADTESGTAQMAMTNAQIDGRRMRDQPDCLMIDCLLLRRERRY